MKGTFLLLLMLCLSLFLWLSCGRSEVPHKKQPEKEQTLGVEKKPVVKKDSEAVPEKPAAQKILFIKNKGYKKYRKQAVMFTHRKHEIIYKISCVECHHTYKSAEGVWRAGDPNKPCVECHDPLKRKGAAYKLQVAYHRSCRPCHSILLMLGKSEKAPFRRCGDCHGRSEG